MTRKEQIEKEASQNQPGNNPLIQSCYYCFVRGAQWADENPHCPCLMNNALLVNKEQQLAIAEEALMDYEGMPGMSCRTSTTKWSTASEALAKIKELKSK
jgi:hypothetical protein